MKKIQCPGFVLFYSTSCPDAHTLGVDVRKYLNYYMEHLESDDCHAAASTLRALAAKADRERKNVANRN